MFHSLTRTERPHLSPSFPSSPSSNPVACRPGPDRRRLPSLRPPRLGKRDAAYPADHASRHSDRGCRRLDATTGRSTRYPPRRKRAANQAIKIRGDEKPQTFVAPHSPFLPHPLSLFSNLTHHPHVCATVSRPHVGSALDCFPFGTRWTRAQQPCPIPASSSPSFPSSIPNIHPQSQVCVPCRICRT